MFTYDALVCGRLTAVIEGSREDLIRLRWTDDLGGPCTVALGAERFERHIESGVIVIVDPAEVCNRLKLQAATSAASTDPAHAPP